MKMSEAVAMLERMQNPEPYEPQISEKAFDALGMAINALMLMRWIPVSERLPERGVPVLATGKRGGIHIARIRTTGEWTTVVKDFPIHPKAWMPLPEPWEGDKE